MDGGGHPSSLSGKPSGSSLNDHYVLLTTDRPNSKAHCEHRVVACPTWKAISLKTFTIFRVLAFSWMMTAGIIYGWFFSESNSWSTSPPVVYLTEWTFVAACTYMGLASFASLTLLLDEHDRATNTNSLEGAFSHAAAQFSEVQLDGSEGWYSRATRVAFHIAVVLEPCIVIGFWALVYPVDNECSFPNCYTVHGIGAVFVVFDGLVNSLELTVKMIHWPLGYAAAWLLSQFLWVYTNHAPDYSVLTLRDVGSAYVAVGGFIALALVFFFERAVFRRFKASATWQGDAQDRFESAPEATF